MSEDVDDGFVVRAMLVMGQRSAREQAEILRSAVNALGTFEGEPFAEQDRRSQAFIAGGETPDDMTVLLTHSKFEGLWEGDSGWITLSVMDDGPKQPTYVFLSTNIGPAECQADRQWAVGMSLIPQLAGELEPDLAFMNGKPVSDETFNTFPEPSEIDGAGLPAAITPWIYLSNERLNAPNTKRWLEALPVHEVHSLRGGVTVSVIERLKDQPSPRLDAALARAPGGRIRYIAPKLEL